MIFRPLTILSQVHDFESPFLIVGASYTCTSTKCGHKLQSTNPRLLALLPEPLRKEFPAVLLPDEEVIVVKGDEKKPKTGTNVWNWSYRGVSRALWSLVVDSRERKLSRADVLGQLDRIKVGAPPPGNVQEDVIMEEQGDVPQQPPVRLLKFVIL